MYCYLRFYLFLERGEKREKERERNMKVWLPLTCPQMGTCPTHPDWESNQGPFSSQAGTPSTEPHQPGLNVLLNIPMSSGRNGKVKFERT